MSDFNLNDHTHRLLIQEPFFAALSRRIDKMKDTGIPTAGVRVNPDNGYFELRYNPEFFDGLTDDQRSGVLVHEFYHLVFEHVTGRLPDELAGVMSSGSPSQEQAQLFKIWNIAAALPLIASSVVTGSRSPAVTLAKQCLKICRRARLLNGITRA